MAKFNIHGHTFRCGHASGTDEEYVLSAIEAGFEEIGFSDHVYFPSIIQKGVRMNEEDAEGYYQSVLNLREKYKDKIKIYLGFEAEYFDEFKSHYKFLLKNKVDYLILGQHFAYSSEGYLYYGNKRDNKEIAKQYVDNVIKAMKSGLFKYVAHPDIFLNSYTIEDEFSISLIKKICEASLKYDVPLEVNLEGVRRKIQYGDIESLKDQYYPYGRFWKIVSEYKCKVIVGYDCHAPKQYLKDESGEVPTMKLIKEFNLNIIDRVDIKYR